MGMIFVSSYERVPVLREFFLPREMVSIDKRAPRKALAKQGKFLENRLLSPTQFLTDAYERGDVDEYSYRVLYRNYLAYHVPARQLRRNIDAIGVRVFLTYEDSPYQEVFVDWVNKNVAPCRVYLPSFDVEFTMSVVPDSRTIDITPIPNEPQPCPQNLPRLPEPELPDDLPPIGQLALF